MHPGMIRHVVFFLASLLVAATFPPAFPAPAHELPEGTFRVAETFNGAPFEYQGQLLADRGQFRIFRLTYPSPVVTPIKQNNTIPANYYMPQGLRSELKYPAVICLHILDGNEQLTDLMCSALAARGIPAISFKLPYYGERGFPRGPAALLEQPKLFIGALEQAGEDIRRTVDLLASRPEINPQHIGITGISLGGIVAATVAGAEPRLHRAVLILSGGDLPRIIAHAGETELLRKMLQQLPSQDREEVERRILEVDPLHFAELLAPRAKAGKVLMLNAAEDEVIPRECTEKLAAALGISEKVVWFEGLNHYTALAALPRALRITVNFFAQDLPPGAVAPPTNSVESAEGRALKLIEQLVAFLSAEPEPGRCHLLDAELLLTNTRSSARIQFVLGHSGRFALRSILPEIGEVALGQSDFSWLAVGGKKLFVGVKNAHAGSGILDYVEPRHRMMPRLAAGLGGAMLQAPSVLRQWINVEEVSKNADEKQVSKAIRITAKDQRKTPGEIIVDFAEDETTPAVGKFEVAGLQGMLRFHALQTSAVAQESLFNPPKELPQQEVEQEDLQRVIAAAINFSMSRFAGTTYRRQYDNAAPLTLIARDPAGHGLLCHTQGKTILMVSGSPGQMGAAHGTLLASDTQRLLERVVYLVGGVDTVHSGVWFFDRMAEIQRLTAPHVPARFFEECDALAQAAGVSGRDARYGNLFPERFHCSGVALCGSATLGGKVLHARVLDYMRDIDLQTAATVTVFLPEGRRKWMSLGYAGFIGTVTAINECGLAVGEIGGRGEGLWNGLPMSFLLREVMERAANVDEALKIIEQAPRTCEYYYVLSDRQGALRALHCRPEKMTVLLPGQQHPLLPFVPPDTVLISGDERAKVLSRRLQENYGQIDVPKLIEIIKRPVAMRSNLHNAIFAPETLEMWCADAGRDMPACDEPYARISLRELLKFYDKNIREPEGQTEPSQL